MRLHYTSLFIHTAYVYLAMYLTMYERVNSWEIPSLVAQWNILFLRWVSIYIEYINSHGYLPRRNVRTERKQLKAGGWKKPVSSNKELITVAVNIMNSAWCSLSWFEGLSTIKWLHMLVPNASAWLPIEIIINQYNLQSFLLWGSNCVLSAICNMKHFPRQCLYQQYFFQNEVKLQLQCISLLLKILNQMPMQYMLSLTTAKKILPLNKKSK